MATTVAVGNVSVSTNGALTGQLLGQFASALSASTPVTVTSNALPPSDGKYDQTLLIPASVTGAISVPAGYEFVIYQGTQGSLVSSDPKEIIIGDLNYAGGAGTVLSVASSPSAASNGMVADSTAGAMLSFAGSSNSVTASGAGQTVQLDGTTNMIWLTAASGATSTVFANGAGALGGNWVSMGGAAGEFVGGGATNSVYGGAGADTVIAGTSVLYTGTSGSNLFVGGTGTSTVYGAAKETIYGGTGNGVYSLAANSTDFVVAHGGAASSSMVHDTVMLGSGSVMADVWGNANESMSIGAAPSATGALVVAYGTNDSIALANTSTAGAVNNEIVMWNANFGPGAFTGNTTLTGSSAGHDVYVMFGNLTQFGSTAEAAHTIVINNWQSTDLLNLSAGYSSTDVATAQAAIGAGNTSFTLSDGTTVQLNGAKPGTGQIYHQ